MTKFNKASIRILFLIIVFSPQFIFSQNKTVQEKVSPADVDRYKQDATRLISFLEYSMNIVGSDSTSVEDKESVIYSSYLKIFQDKKVLIEDDLDVNRKTPSCKPVQAYLQDIDYFYKKVLFTLDIENIEFSETDTQPPFFKVTLTRHLKGIDLNGIAVENSLKRYIELNIDTHSKELKVVSIYTTKLNEKEDLFAWWNGLSADWKKALTKAAGTSDSVHYDQLKQIIVLEKLDLSNFKKITDFSPLDKLTELKQLDLSGTSIADLDVIRNLTQLEVLKLNDTPLNNAPPLKYLHKLSTLEISNTWLSSLDFIKSFPELKKLSCSAALIFSLAPVSSLKYLEELDCSYTPIKDINALSQNHSLIKLSVNDTKIDNIKAISTLTDLQSLNISNTLVTSLKPAASLKKLNILSFDNSPVSTLDDLSNMPALKKIHCDNTLVGAEEAVQYMNRHKDVLVLYQSGGLVKWWNSLNTDWKKVFSRSVQISDVPAKEQLAALVNIDSIDISGNQKITDLAPLKMVLNLKVLRISNTAVTQLDPIAELVSLQMIDITNTKIKNINALGKLRRLSLLKCDDTPIDSLTLALFIEDNSRCTVVYKSAELKKWWGGLNSEWKSAFRNYTRLDPAPTAIQLHKLIKLDSINISGRNFKKLDPLKEFSSLHYLNISNTDLAGLTDLVMFNQLRTLDISNNPFIDLTPIGSMSSLKNINCSNTAVKDLTPLIKISKLEILNCSGTHVKNIKPLASLININYLNISNTLVKNISYLENLKKIKTLICFNTKISKRKIAQFQLKSPSCKVSYF